LPFDRGDLLAAAHREGDVLDTSVSDDGVLIHVVLDDVSAARLVMARLGVSSLLRRTPTSG